MDIKQIEEWERYLISEHEKNMEAVARLKRAVSPTVPDKRQMTIPLTRASNVSLVNDDDDTDEASVQPLKHKVRDVVNADSTTKWTTQKVLNQLKADGYPLKAQKPIYSIGQALQKLVQGGEIRLTRKGSGSEPNIYKGIPKPEASEGESVTPEQQSLAS